MKKGICGFIVLVMFLSSPARSETKVFQISVTIPATASLINPNSGHQTPSKGQLKQTQQLIRDNKMKTITSIVVP
jgi:ABC-type Zn uptake system ZnuABC Zn-binding protein ZnuA